MYPYKFKILKKRTIPAVKYYYHHADLQKWHRRGRQHGDCGMILVERQGQILRYWSYGTIEHPFTTMCKVSVIHNTVMDGPMPTDEQRCTPPDYTLRKLQTTKFVLLDLTQ